MKYSVILLVIAGLLAGSQADIQDTLSNVKDVAIATVNKLGDTLKDKLLEVGQNLLGNLLADLGKRELSMDTAKEFFGKLKDKLDEHKGRVKDAFTKAMGKFKDLVAKFHKHVAEMKDAKKANEAVDAIVDEHHKEQKRILSDLANFGKGLFTAFTASVKDALATFKVKASDATSKLIQKGADLIAKTGIIGKRATLSDHLQTIGSAISSAVNPFKDVVSNLGNTLKGHFSNLVDTVKGHVNTLSGKLSGHVEDLKTHGKTLLNHGKNALGALSEVVADILNQTLTNAKPAIDSIAKTAVDAGNTVVNHFTGGKTN